MLEAPVRNKSKSLKVKSWFAFIFLIELRVLIYYLTLLRNSLHCVYFHDQIVLEIGLQSKSIDFKKGQKLGVIYKGTAVLLMIQQFVKGILII